MDNKKRKRLEASGWKVGTVDEFLGETKSVNELLDELLKWHMEERDSKCDRRCPFHDHIERIRAAVGVDV